MDVLEAYDLTKSLRAAAELTAPTTTPSPVVAARAAGVAVEIGPRAAQAATGSPTRSPSGSIARRQVRVDIVHERLVAMGYTARSAPPCGVRGHPQASYRHANHRIYRPWVPEGLWLHTTSAMGLSSRGRGPCRSAPGWRGVASGSSSRSPIGPWARSSPCSTARFASSAGASTYVLTDNEKTVTDRHIAGIPAQRVHGGHGHYYGVTICTVPPDDPESRAARSRRSDRQGRPGAHRGQSARRVR